MLLLLLSATTQAFVAPAFSMRSPCTTEATASRLAASVILMKEKKDVLELEGTVLESMPNANFRVQLDDTDQVRCRHRVECCGS